MALIDSFERKDRERNSAHDPIGATFTTFEIGADKYFQLDTYGRSTREIPGKISQSIQLNRESAATLVSLLRREFDLKG
ncbi:MAG: methionyl-tRNA formyltransferase [Alphaproteobacteria bacterium]|nr:methionyl-tRNA formyltransferase [Alphaproteobacteria bacterium]